MTNKQLLRPANTTLIQAAAELHNIYLRRCITLIYAAALWNLHHNITLSALHNRITLAIL